MFIHCDCSIDCDDPAEVDDASMRRARKQHKCGECRRIIEVGEQYEVWDQLWEGHWDRHKTCLGCLRIRQHLSPHGWIWGGLAEAVARCVGFNYVTGREVNDGNMRESENR